MKVSKKYIAYSTILGLAVTAWGIDYAFFGPKPAAAMAVAAAEEPAAAAADSAAAASEPKAEPVGRIADKLQSLPGNGSIESQSLRNAFALSSRWIAATRPQATLPREQWAQTFQHAHHVLAIMTDKNGGRAIVDDRLLRIGESIDGFQLISVNHRSASFRGHGAEVILSVGENLMMADSE